MQNLMINNVSIPVLEVNGQRVMTCADIDRVHGRRRGTASCRFHSNKERFILGTDYFEMTNREFYTELIASNAIKGNPNFKTRLLTKSGYLMLVKVFNDDKAWDVQRRLVECYFDTQRPKMEVKAPAAVDTFAPFLEQLTSVLVNQNKLIDAMMELISSMKPGAEVPRVEAKTEVPKLEAKVEVPKVEAPNTKNKPKAKRQNPDNSLVPDDYKKWKADLYEMLDGYDKKTIIAAACNRLHVVFGVSWTEERTAFHRHYERIPVDGNLELAYNIEQRKGWQNIFVNAVCDIADEYGKVVVPYNYPAKTIGDVRGIIREVAKKRNEYHSHGSHLYNHMISTFKKETGFDMDKAEEMFRHAKNYGKRTKVKKMDIIDFICKEQFLDWFNKFAAKEYKEVM